MKVFMTGATGFIGRATVLRLQRDGHQISAWVRSPQRARSALGAGVTLVDAAGGAEAMTQAVAAADAVINLAGEPIMGRRWTKARRQALVDSRVDLTTALVAAMRAAPNPPRTLISASAVGYYGNRPGQELDERAQPSSGFAADLCAQWEAAAIRAEEFGTRVALLRIGVVLGAGGGMLGTILPAFRAGLGGPLGSGRQILPWIHLDDMVEIIAFALVEDRLSGPINCAAPNRLSQRQFAQHLGRRLRRPAVLPAPEMVLRLALGEAAGIAFASQHVVPSALIGAGFRFRFSDAEDALGDILDPVGSCVVESAADRAASVPASSYLERRRPHYVLDQTTVIEAPLSEVFGFFSKAENLGIITPPSMSFQIQTPTPIAMHTGTVIDYRIELGAVPMKWRTVIEHWEPGTMFVDAQHRGPYRAWWHEHHFQDAGDRTIMRDLVYYAPPLGILGRVANRLFIERMLRSIFDYRSSAIRLRFGTEPDTLKRAA